MHGCRECAANEMGEMNAREIDQLNHRFEDSVKAAQSAVRTAHKAVEDLVSSRFFDIELAEGHDGRDAIRELQTAARALRNAQRIAEGRRGLLTAAGTAETAKP